MLKKIKNYTSSLSDVGVEYYMFNEISIRYIFYNNTSRKLPLLVLIHGTPGSSSALIDLLKYPQIVENYSIVLVDRLGYGYSNYGKYSSIKDQSDAIISLINSIKTESQKVFIAGHSYGGTITAAIASLRPEFLSASALMAPALDPENEKYFWFGKFGKWKASRWMASGALKVAADEKYSHASELRVWQPKWQNINRPILHIHGNKDKVVPFQNVEFAKLNFPKEFLKVHTWEGMSHFFPFSESDKTVLTLHNYFQSFIQ